MRMKLDWNAAEVSRAIVFSNACCAAKYHWRGSLAEGFMPLAHSNAARPKLEPESRTNTVFSPHSEGSESSLHFVISFAASTNALGLRTTGPVGPLTYLSRTVS